jgi:putative hydrolase of the HAD superfamily
MEKSKPKAIIFDAFGVLISDGIRGMAKKLALEMGLTEWPEFFQQLPFWQENWQKLWRGEISEEEMEKGITPQLGEEKARRFFAGWRGLTKADKKMLDLLRELKKKKDFKLGFLVNTPPKLLEYLKQEIPLSLFDEVVFSCEAGLIKPDQRIFEKMVKKLGVKMVECLFIDDSQENIEAAKKLEMQTIQFKNKRHLEEELKTKGVI